MSKPGHVVHVADQNTQSILNPRRIGEKQWEHDDEKDLTKKQVREPRGLTLPDAR